MSMRYPGGFLAPTPVTANYPSGVWTQAQAIPYQQQNVWTRDRFWPYTSLLLNGNGTNGAQNNTFLDSSTNNFTITRNGNTTQGSFTPYEQEGYWSNYFDGTGDYLSAANNAAFAYGTGDFTYEFWFFRVNNTGTPSILDQRNTEGTATGLSDFISGTNKYSLFSANTTIFTSNTPVNSNQWTHIAVSRSGTTLRVFINGFLDGSITNSTNFSDQALLIGVNRGVTAGSVGTSNFNGYISNLRIVKGTALYTANFDPPTTPLSAITNTSLLTCQSNRFRDASTNNFAITRNGDTSVQAFQPFPGATTYSGTVLGGSGYFDGTGDWLSIPRNTAFLPGVNEDFTFEAWVYLTSVPTSAEIVGLSEAGLAGDWEWVINTSLQSALFIGTASATYTNTTTLLTLNAWNHVAISRSGTAANNLKIFVNGIGQSFSVNNSLNNSQTYPLTIGADQNGDENLLRGYISNLRIVKGTALYTANFTPPTAPLTAITNTSLLLNFTNAGIADSAAMNDLETVGNAQVSTSVVKYGTGSMAFDGNGDRLTIPGSSNIVFGIGDFTIEYWMYPLTNTSTNRMMGNGTSPYSANDWSIWPYNATGKLAVDIYNISSTANAMVSTTTMAPNAWYHVALVRSGNVFRLFINGNQESTVTSSVSFDGGVVTPLYVGDSGFSEWYNGYIDDLRITKGVARYITNFTPPPARLPGQ